MKPSELIEVVARCVGHNLPLLIKSSPGLGKSQCVVAGIRQAHGDNVRIFFLHPVCSDPTDYKGLPVKTEEGVEFLPIGDMRRICEPSDVPTVVFIDDLGQSSPSVQGALMQLLEARQVGEHRVAEGTTFIAATNASEHRAGVRSILAPLLNRFHSIVSLEADVEDWCGWAAGQGLPADLIAFCKFKPEWLQQGWELHVKNSRPDAIENFASPRSIAKFGALLNAGFDPLEEVGRGVLSGACGEAFALDYVAFARYRAALPDWPSIVADPAGALMPTQAGAQYAAVGLLAGNVDAATVGQAFTYAARLGKELEFLLGKTLLRSPKHREVIATRTFADWLLSNQDYLL